MVRNGIRTAELKWLHDQQRRAGPNRTVDQHGGAELNPVVTATGDGGTGSEEPKGRKEANFEENADQEDDEVKDRSAKTHEEEHQSESESDKSAIL
ncbi:hypothetical protein KC316_g1176 [Hortaea werneckii]|nr:hypothetical protein KC324_g214 [Hortaea werneckii]KAI7594356.1 hypothetical protein KC316_g1176 [Hortaea werneckii]